MSTDLLYSDVEEQLRTSVRDLLGARAPLSGAVARAEWGQPYDTSLWTALARDLGVSGLAVPESAGGHGGSWREIALVAEELGRAVAATPFLGSAVLATAAALDAGSAELVSALAAGTSTAALVVPLSMPPDSAFPGHVRFDGAHASGRVRHVADAATADLLLVPAVGPDGPVLLRVEAGAARREPVTSLDLTRPLSDVHLDGAPGSAIVEGDGAVHALEAALLAGAVVLASE